MGRHLLNPATGKRMPSRGNKDKNIQAGVGLTRVRTAGLQAWDKTRSCEAAGRIMWHLADHRKRWDTILPAKETHAGVLRKGQT